MIFLLLSILKILGIILLVLLGIVLLVVLLILFVPLRYTLEARRQEESEEAFSLKAKATWLLHLLNVHAQYPQTPYLRARILCFTLFSTDKKPDEKSEEKKEPKEGSPKASSKKPEKAADKEQDGKVAADASAGSAKETLSENTEFFQEGIPEKVQEEIPGEESEEDSPTILKFLKRIFSIIQNIRYTIRKICDKIKHIVKNIRYYLAIIKSDAFKRAFGLCKSQVWELLYSIRPRKIKGSILVGTGDPASTGQVFAVYGILYPLLGDQIAVTPDFERQVLAGELFVKGKVTVFWLVRAAWIIYFNKDLRRIIKMFKREAA